MRRDRWRRFVALTLWGACLVGCGATRTVPSEPGSRGAESSRERALDGESHRSAFVRALEPDRWVAPLGREHPLIGRVFSPRRAAFVPPDEVVRDVGRARFVLLGEKHDNPDHQRLHAAWIETIASGGRRPACVLEMLEAERQAALDAASGDEALRRDVDAFARAIEWAASGWPWERYRGVVSAALEARLELRAGNYPRARVRRIVREGEAALDPAERARLGLDHTLPEAEQSALVREMALSHCAMLPEALLAPMALAQRARDGEMAAAMARSEGGAVLVAGSGHVRLDRGVPRVLALSHSVAATATRAIAYVEVLDAVQDPSAYARGFGTEVLPFDYVVFSPRASDDDPCEAMRTHGDRSAASSTP